jgi:hypothetical protein
MVVITQKQMQSIHWYSPIDRFLRGVAKLKDDTRWRFYTFYFVTWKHQLSTWLQSHYQAQVSFLRVGNMLEPSTRIVRVLRIPLQSWF